MTVKVWLKCSRKSRKRPLRGPVVTRLATFCCRMQCNQYASLFLVALVLGQAAALPQSPQYGQQVQQRPREDRKFAEKPNAMKKVGIDDLNEVNSNQIQVRVSCSLVASCVRGGEGEVD